MEEILSIDLPGFKATYKVNWLEDSSFEGLQNAGQADCILFNSEGKILIVNIVGNWQLPGGHIEKGETYIEGLKREVNEEADAEIEDITPIGYIKAKELKEGSEGPEFIQLKYFGKIKELKEQTIDPAYNKIPERKFINPEEFTNYIPWGNVGERIINRAKEIFFEKKNSKPASEGLRLGFMEPFKEFIELKKDIDQFMAEVHPIKINKDYLEFVSRNVSYKDLSGDIAKSLTLPNWDMLNRPRSYLRPMIFLLLMRGLGKDPIKYLKYSAIIELIHNGTLIHDDIEDNAQIRRGDAPTYKKYGIDIAVNSANLLYFTPFLIFKRYGGESSESIKLRAYDSLIEHLNRVTWGQGLDILWHKTENIPNKEEYLQMCCYKTGAIDRMVFSLAAVLAEVDSTKKEIMENFGEKLGICLQIHDDLSDICSIDRSIIGGKVVGNDISEGKKSIVNLIALKNLQLEDQKKLLNILNEQTQDRNKINEAMKLIKKSKAIEEVISEADKRFSELILISPKILSSKESEIMNEFLAEMVKDINNKFSEFNKNESNN